MVQQSKMNTPDLPEPIQRWLTEDQKLERQWRLLTFVLTFVALYAVIHKLVIPAALNLTSLQGTAYCQIDWWFFHPVILAFYIRRIPKNDALLSFLCGVAILYGGYEVYENFVGRNPGWLAFSRLLSSTPLAVACSYLMTRTKHGGSISFSWIGAFVLSVWIIFREIALTSVSSASFAAQRFEIENQAPVVELVLCGAKELYAKKGIGNRTSQIFIKDCGLMPSLISIDEGYLEIVNEKSDSINLHLVSSEGGKPKTEWNLLVPAKSKIQTKKIRTSPQSMMMLYSDSAPKVGIVALQNSAQKLEWILKRKPISFERKP